MQTYCVKRVQTRSYLWSVFSRIWTEYGDLWSKSPYLAKIRENMDQEKLRIWALYMQWLFFTKIFKKALLMSLPNVIYFLKWFRITPGEWSALQDNSDFMNKIETNNLIMLWILTSLEMKVTVDKGYFGTTVTNW